MLVQLPIGAWVSAGWLACQVASLRDRLTGRLRRGQWVGFAGTITLAVGGVLGGHLAHKLPARAASRSATAD